MMSKRRCSGHSSPTGVRTNGGASTTNTITPPIFGLSTPTQSLPLKLHMQKHHPTQKHPEPHSTYNPHHHNRPFSSKSLTSLAITHQPLYQLLGPAVMYWRSILQQRGYSLRLHGSVFMYYRPTTLTQFHSPEKKLLAALRLHF